MNQQQYERWSLQREKGEKHFIWIYGVLLWGIISAVLWAVAMAYFAPADSFMSRVIVAFIIFPLSGYFLGKRTWKKNEDQFEAFGSEE